MKFVWDEAKRLANLTSHGLDFLDTPKIFGGPVLEFADTRHDYGEDRLIGIGFLHNFVVVLVYTELEEESIRVVSLRKALTHERERFEAYLKDRLG